MGTVNLDKEGMGMDLNDLAFLDFCLQVFCQSLKLLRQCLRQLTLAMPSTRETPQGRGRKSLRLGGDSHMKRLGMLSGNFCFDP